MSESTKPEYHPPGLEHDHKHTCRFTVLQVRKTPAPRDDCFSWTYQLLRSDGIVLAQEYGQREDAQLTANEYNRRAHLWEFGVHATEAELARQRAELELEVGLEVEQRQLEQRQLEQRQLEQSSVEQQLGYAIDALERSFEHLRHHVRSNVDRLDAIEATLQRLDAKGQ